MTVTNTTTARDSYDGNGVTTVFVHHFRILDDDEILVTLVDSAGVEEVLVKTTDYSVSDVGEAEGSVTINTALRAIPADGYQLVLTRNMDATQGVNLVNTGKFPAENVEEALDRAVMLIQQLNEVIARTLRLPVGTSLSSIELPQPSGGQAIVWNGDATGLINADIDPGSIASAVDESAGNADAAFASASLASGYASVAEGFADQATTYGVSAVLYLANNYV